MLLPSYYVLNERVHILSGQFVAYFAHRIATINQHTIYPYIHSLSNATSPEALLRGVSFPDILPSSLPPGSKFSMVAGDFEEIYGAQEDPEKDDTEQWDAVLTCFFIDTVSLVGTLLAYYSKLR
jgi:carnosine N-methyltransferase